jgi:hypothetical protein
VKEWIIRWQWRLSNEPTMPHDNRFIAASEIGTWCYCKKRGTCVTADIHAPSRKSALLESDITKPTIAACEPPTSSRR